MVEKGDTSSGAHVPDFPGCVAAAETCDEVLKLMKTDPPRCRCRDALKQAIWSDFGAIDPVVHKRLEPLIGHYLNEAD